MTTANYSKTCPKIAFSDLSYKNLKMMTAHVTIKCLKVIVTSFKIKGLRKKKQSIIFKIIKKHTLLN